jgi:hypothetical protein
MIDPFDQTRKANDVKIIIITIVAIRNVEVETLDGTGISREQNRVHNVIKISEFFLFIEMTPEAYNEN